MSLFPLLLPFPHLSSSCRKNTEEYKDSCPTQMEAFRKKALGLIGNLREDLENQYKDDVKVLCCHTQAHIHLLCFHKVLHSKKIQKRTATLQKMQRSRLLWRLAVWLLFAHHPTSVHRCSPAVLEKDADAQVAHQRRRLQAATRPHGATVTGLFRHEPWPRQGEEERRTMGAESSRMGGGSGLFGISSGLLFLHRSGPMFVVTFVSGHWLFPR